jgi:hypothetical protein
MALKSYLYEQDRESTWKHLVMKLFGLRSRPGDRLPNVSKHWVKKAYRPVYDLVKDETGCLHADSQNILNTWKNYFCQTMNAHGT